MFKRFLRVFGLAAIGLGATAGLAAASTQTQSQFDNTSAYAVFAADKSYTFVSASRGTYEFESDGTQFEQSGTFVRVSIYGPNGYEFGCFNVPDSLTGGLAGAQLHVNVGPGTGNCGGKFLGGPSEKGGGGPGFGSGLSQAYQIDLTWTPTGALNQNSGSYSHSCLDYSTSNQYSSNSVAASASGTIAGNSVTTSGGFKFGAQLSTSQGESQREGTPASGCYYY